MKGDFSQSNGHLSIRPEDNYSGVLHQQGRVLLDSDWNEQTGITNRWQDQAGRDVVGPAVAAIPAADPAGFLIRSAVAHPPDLVELAVGPGRVWADGLLAYLPGEGASDVRTIATYLQPPVQDPPGTASGLDEGVSDAVVLEVWREALSAFQEHHTLIEPALGGPDTTERVLTQMRFRLFRMAKGDTCRSIVAGLQDDFSKKGKLKVSLQPSTSTNGDCPAEDEGGYVGFEHSLYRVEIALVDDPQAMFKWSQFNGGLVGRGDCELGGADKKFVVTHNDQAIKMSGLDAFYLEVVEKDDDQGFWRVTYGAEATLDGDDLDIAQVHYEEANLPSGNVFFRLWNGIEPVSSYLKATPPATLRDGIRLEFDAAGASNHGPGDYWTFQVRAGDIANPEILIDDEPPQGILYHRVPLAILNWNGAGNISFEDGEIEDCRDIFQPLTNQSVCCTFTVGDGVSSHGDFDSIQQAIRHLPATGGNVCLLPGVHQANVIIRERRDIKVRGCGKRTRVIPGPNDRDGAIFRIIDSRGITLEGMDLITFEGAGILAEGTKTGALVDLEIHDNRVLAYEFGVRATLASNLRISHNKINVLDKERAGVAVYVMAEDSTIENNTVSVVPAEASPTTPEDTDEEQPTDPTDPCADVEAVYGEIAYVATYADFLWEAAEIYAFEVPDEPPRALGGIQVAGGSERVAVLGNTVRGGAGNGITLGTDFVAPDSPGAVDNDDAVDRRFSHTGTKIQGWVVEGNSGVDGIALSFEGESGISLKTVSSDDGFFQSKAAPDDYTVSIASPGYRIEDVEVVVQSSFGVAVSQPVLGIRVAREEAEPEDVLAFMYGIRLEENEISGMGLSGIGIPRASEPEDTGVLGAVGPASDLAPFAEIFARLGNPVVDLTIRGNRILGCLQTPFDSDMRAEARLRGFGGVALGMCGRLSVHENRIENNGTTHVEPACGLYLAYGERVEITHNTILENGPIDTEQSDELQPGVRGGIFLGIASSLPVLSHLAQEKTRLPQTAFASRVHDNVVEQPAGHALRIMAVGSASVQGNRFASRLSGPEDYEVMVGAVLILNLGGVGGSWSILGRQAFPGAVGKAAFSRTAWGMAGGNVLFNGNETWVDPANESPVSQFIVSMDDIGFDGNQSDNLSASYLASNTALLGATLRATDNRFKEVLEGREDSLRISLFTLTSLMNNTTNNQGNHCIFAINQGAKPVFASGNQVLDDGLCGGDDSIEVSHGRVEVIDENIPDHPAGPLNELFDDAREGRLETLGDLDHVHIASQFMLQNEAWRLEMKIGENHPKMRSLTASLEQNLDNLEGIGLELELAGTEVAEVDEDQALVHGRVVDERAHGMEGLFVSISDEEGRTLTPLGRAETDASGYYALVVDPAALARVSEAAREGVFLTVRTEQGELVYQQFEPLTIAEGDRKTAEMVLEQGDLVGGGRRTEYRRDTDSEGPEVVRVVDLEEVPGIGPTRADNLRQAGIPDVRALHDADDETLRGILGNVDVQKLKQDSAALLER